MYLITNRNILNTQGGPEILSHKPNAQGPNELRLVHAIRKHRTWQLKVLPNKITTTTTQKNGNQVQQQIYASQFVANQIFKKINPHHTDQNSSQQGKNILFFIHGYNNNVQDVLDRALTLQKKYNLIVIPFTWPANGGGHYPSSGITSYKSDKRDAKASIGALDRTLTKFHHYLNQFNQNHINNIHNVASTRYKENAERRDAFIAKHTQQTCPFTINLLAHSMGNYLFKHLLKSSASEGTKLLFDNIILAAADTNAARHEDWVDQILARNRIYITINEKDIALAASRMKLGQEQTARLGHCPHHLKSQQATYIQFTNVKHVGHSHAYFEGNPLKNPNVKQFFSHAFNGQSAEHLANYHPATRMYHI